MNKKTNTFLFIIAGTLFNIITTILCFFVLLFVFAKLFSAALADSSYAWVFPVIFIAAIIASFFIYRLVIKIIIKKVDMDKYFHPIFGKRRQS